MNVFGSVLKYNFLIIFDKTAVVPPKLSFFPPSSENNPGAVPGARQLKITFTDTKNVYYVFRAQSKVCSSTTNFKDVFCDENDKRKLLTQCSTFTVVTYVTHSVFLIVLFIILREHNK